jgi:hypothetical protein
MALDAAELDRVAVASLSEHERPLAAVYVIDHVHETGAELEIDGGHIHIDAPTVVAFVDLEPGVNWGHRCRYLLLDRDSGEVRALEAQFPPFLRGVPPGLRLAYRGAHVPDWAIATD